MTFVNGNPDVRSQFIALSCLWALWELLLAARYCAGDYDRFDFERRETVNNNNNVGNNGTVGGRPNDANNRTVVKPVERRARLGDGIERAQRLVRDNLLSFVLILTTNYFAAGGVESVEGLAWAYFAVSFVWLIAEAVSNKSKLRFAFWVFKFGILVAILGIAFGADTGFNNYVNRVTITQSA